MHQIDVVSFLFEEKVQVHVLTNTQYFRVSYLFSIVT